MKKNYIVFLHHVVFSMLSHAVLYPNLFLCLIFNVVFDFANLSTDKLGLEMTVNLSSCLWCCGALLHEPGAYLGRTGGIEFLQGKNVRALLEQEVQTRFLQSVHLHEFVRLLFSIFISYLN